MSRTTRIHGARRVLQELRRLRIKVERAYVRAAAADEQKWIRRTADALDRAIAEGDEVLPGLPDPRDARRARKRPLPLV